MTGERDRDERMAKVVQADRPAAVTVQACGITGRVNGAERVTARLRLAAGGREDQRVRVDAPEVDARLLRPMLAQLAQERRKQPYRCRAGDRPAPSGA